MSGVEQKRNVLVVPAYGGVDTQDPRGVFQSVVAELQKPASESSAVYSKFAGLRANVFPLPYPDELAEPSARLAYPESGGGRLHAARYLESVVALAEPRCSGLLIVNPDEVSERVPEMADPLRVEHAIGVLTALVAEAVAARIEGRRRVPVWTTHELPRYGSRGRVTPDLVGHTRNRLNGANAKSLTVASHLEKFRRFYTPAQINRETGDM